MNKREIVQTLMDSVQKGDFEHAKSMLADDFVFSGPVPEPIDAQAWLEMGLSIKAAFPSLDYHFKVIGTERDVVRSTTQWSGTHSGPLDLTTMNMGVIPATNRSFSAKTARVRITVRGDKVTSWAEERTEGAGIKAILGQLGVSPILM